MRNYTFVLLVASSLATTACVSNWDMQGHDPQEYYAKHPIENKVETRFLTQKIGFASMDPAAEDRNALKTQMAQISTEAIESVEIQLHPSQMNNAGRNDQLRRLVTKNGVPRSKVKFVAAEDIMPSEANVQVAYAAVVSPRCPDWRSSAVTSYANTMYTGNISCATRTNLGLMVANPRDLVEGTGDNRGDANNAAKAVQNYRNATAAPVAADGGAEATGSGAATTGQ